MSKTLSLTIRLLVVCAGAFVLQANAATVSREFQGNDCSGYFGTGFDSCTIFVNSMGERIELSPVIAKFEEDLSLDEVNNTVFPSVDGSEFSFSDPVPENVTGTWNYTPYR